MSDTFDSQRIQEYRKFVRENLHLFGALGNKMYDLRQDLNRQMVSGKKVDIKITRKECEQIIVAIALSLDSLFKTGGGPITNLEFMNSLGKRTLDLD